jgi:hypothetical protein
MAEHFPTPWSVDTLTATVYSTATPKEQARVADMRGWGYLTGKGHGALALPEDEAIDIQRANAAFIVKAVNNHDQLTSTIDLLEKNAAIQARLLADTARQRDALVKTLKVARLMIAGEIIEHAVIDTQTRQSLGDAIDAALSAVVGTVGGSHD